MNYVISSYMNNRNLLIYESIEVFRILDKIKDLIHFNIIHLSIKDLQKYNEMDLSKNLIITEKKIPRFRKSVDNRTIPS